jgi:hypothetical protein
VHTARDREMSQLLLMPVFPPPVHLPRDVWKDGYLLTSNDGDDCEYCERNYHSVDHQVRGKRCYNGALTHDQARKQLDSIMKETNDNLAYMRQKLQSHGDLILSRWSKKSRDKRGTMLSTATNWCFGSWPPQLDLDPVPEEYKDDYMTWHPERASQTHWSYAWWILVKDFAEDRMKLMRLLYLRTEYPSQAWTMFDTLESHHAFTAGHAPFISSCVEMFEDNYGRLVDYDESSLHTWAIMSFARAWITMGAQHGISEMLRRMADALIADALPSGDSKWTNLVSNNFSATRSASQ